MNESSAREVLLLQAFETVVPPTAHWTFEDGAWATRLARQDDGAGSDTERFLAARARHAMQRLLPRLPALAEWLERRLWHRGWLVAAALVGAALGLAADQIGSSQRINLLAPPVWTLVAWNVGVYLALVAGAVWRALRPPSARPGGGLVRLTERLLRFGRGLPDRTMDRASMHGSAAAVLRGFAGRWLAVSAPLSACRAATVLHVGAAALGIGLIGGLYARGLVLDYRVAWESTFLSATGVHAALTALLAPASFVSGIALPDVAAVAALRMVHGGAMAAAPAAPWIHLYAWTLLLSVVLPRTALAALGGWQARRMAARFELPLADLYFQRLRRERRSEPARVEVLPYAQTPAPATITGLTRLLAEVFGDRLECRFAALTAFGGEDDVDTLPTVPPATTIAVALFDLGATPEAEHQGRFVLGIAARAPAGAATILLVDEAAFRRRFGAAGQRLAHRRAAWARLGESLGSVAVVVDLEAVDLQHAAGQLQAALAAPLAAESVR